MSTATPVQYEPLLSTSHDVPTRATWNHGRMTEVTLRDKISGVEMAAAIEMQDGAFRSGA